MHRVLNEPHLALQSGEWMTRTLYDILEVAQSASQETIQAAYRSLINRYHPDRATGLGSELQALAAARAKELNHAYDVLKDPARRAAYDDELRDCETACEPHGQGSSFKRVKELFKRSGERVIIFEKKYTITLLLSVAIPMVLVGKFTGDLLFDRMFHLSCGSDTGGLKLALRESENLPRDADFDLHQIVVISKNRENGQLTCSAVAYRNGKAFLKVTYTTVGRKDGARYSEITDINYFRSWPQPEADLPVSPHDEPAAAPSSASGLMRRRSEPDISGVAGHAPRPR